MFCKKCGAQIDDGSRFCSHCGSAVDNVFESHDAANQAPPQQNYFPPQQQYYAPPQQQYYVPPQQQIVETNVFAILGFVFAFIIPILGLVFSILGLKKQQYHGLAMAGMIISIVFVAIFAVIFFTYYSFLLSFLRYAY